MFVMKTALKLTINLAPVSSQQGQPLVEGRGMSLASSASLLRGTSLLHPGPGQGTCDLGTQSRPRLSFSFFFSELPLS